MYAILINYTYFLLCVYNWLHNVLRGHCYQFLNFFLNTYPDKTLLVMMNVRLIANYTIHKDWYNLQVSHIQVHCSVWKKSPKKHQFSYLLYMPHNMLTTGYTHTLWSLHKYGIWPYLQQQEKYFKNLVFLWNEEKWEHLC